MHPIQSFKSSIAMNKMLGLRLEFESWATRVLSHKLPIKEAAIKRVVGFLLVILVPLSCQAALILAKCRSSGHAAR